MQRMFNIVPVNLLYMDPVYQMTRRLYENYLFCTIKMRIYNYCWNGGFVILSKLILFECQACETND